MLDARQGDERRAECHSGDETRPPSDAMSFIDDLIIETIVITKEMAMARTMLSARAGDMMRNRTPYCLTTLTFVLITTRVHAQVVAPSETALPNPPPEPVPSAAPTAQDVEVASPEPARARFELSHAIGFSAPMGLAVTGQTSFGVVLSDHLVWQVGGGLGSSHQTIEGSTLTWRSWLVSTGLEVFTSAPRAGSVSPTIRVGVHYTGGRSAFSWVDQSVSSRSFGGKASGGVTYFVTDRLGVSFDVGLLAERVRDNYLPDAEGASSATSRRFALSTSVALLFRL